MQINNPLKKGLAVAVILLFISIAFAPSVNANVVEDELVEFDVELSGLGKKHNVQLTQTQADEVELLFDDIEQRLSEVETREEAEEIFKDAVVELDKYGLLGGLSVRQAQSLVTGVYNNQGTSSLFENFKNRHYHFDDDDMYEIDLLCLIAGHSNYTIFIGPAAALLGAIWFWLGLLSYSFYFLNNLLEPLMNFIVELVTAKNKNIIPIAFVNCIVLGFYIFHMCYGWLFTAGLTGINSRNGYFSGYVWFFTGLKIRMGELDFFYLGFAPVVQLLRYYPEKN